MGILYSRCFNIFRNLFIPSGLGFVLSSSILKVLIFVLEPFSKPRPVAPPPSLFWISSGDQMMCLLVTSRNLLCLRAWLILQDIISFTNINTVSAGPGLRSLSMIPRPDLSLVQPPPSRALWLVETGHVTQILASHWSRAPAPGLIGSRREFVWCRYLEA